MSNEQLGAGLDLMRRLPPSDVEDNLYYLLDLVPDLTESLLATVDQPIRKARDEKAGRDYLLCDYNRDGDSYRSPWSNTYDPPLEDGAVPSSKLREMEMNANDVFDAYTEAYYGNGVSSTYFWDLDVGFAACVLILKEAEDAKKGNWNSIHVIEIQEKQGCKDTFTYKLTTTIMLSLTTETGGSFNLSGSLTRQAEQDFVLSDENTHVANIGHMVEDMELRLRNTLDQVYFGKTQEVCSNLRAFHGLLEGAERREFQKKLADDLAGLAVNGD